MSFELKGGTARAIRFTDALTLMSITPNLGDTRTTITHPATTTHAKLDPEERLAAGITDGMLRLSAGLENNEDLIADIEQAIWQSGMH